MDIAKIEDIKYTIQDIYDLPKGARAELIDGDMYMMAPPKFRHQDILMKLSAAIHNYIKKKGGKCKVIPAPFGVFLEDDDENYVEPDISIICDPDKIHNDGCYGAPDWIIEIVSPSSKKYDCFIKQEKYRKCGVREYWIVDPKTECVRVFRYGSGDIEEYSFKDKIKAGIYEDLNIDLAELEL